MLQTKQELRLRKFRLLERLRKGRNDMAALAERKRRYALDEF